MASQIGTRAIAPAIALAEAGYGCSGDCYDFIRNPISKLKALVANNVRSNTRAFSV